LPRPTDFLVHKKNGLSLKVHREGSENRSRHRRVLSHTKQDFMNLMFLRGYSQQPQRLQSPLRTQPPSSTELGSELIIRKRLVHPGSNQKFTFQPLSSTSSKPQVIDFFRANEETKSNTGDEDSHASRIHKDREHGVTPSYKQALMSLKIPPVPVCREEEIEEEDD